MKTMCIIGAGSIGATKDKQFDSKKTKTIFTQAHAAWKHPEISLVGICDTDLKKSIDAGNKWDCISYRNYRTMLDELNPEIVSVCTPTETHHKIMRDLLNGYCSNAVNKSPKLVICEKPFCSTIEETKDISELYKVLDVPILIDYIRRFDKSIIRLKNKIKNKKIYSFRLSYGRGLKRDGCHGIDICNYLFGKCESINLKSRISDLFYDGEDDDPSVQIYGRWEKCKQVIFTPIDSRDYSIFEIDIFTEDGRYMLVNSGLQGVTFVKDMSPYGHYQALSPVPKYEETGLNIALLRLMDNAVNYLNGFEPLLCTNTDAIEVHRLIKCIKEES